MALNLNQFVLPKLDRDHAFSRCHGRKTGSVCQFVDLAALGLRRTQALEALQAIKDVLETAVTQIEHFVDSWEGWDWSQPNDIAEAMAAVQTAMQQLVDQFGDDANSSQDEFAASSPMESLNSHLAGLKLNIPLAVAAVQGAYAVRRLEDRQQEQLTMTRQQCSNLRKRVDIIMADMLKPDQNVSTEQNEKMPRQLRKLSMSKGFDAVLARMPRRKWYRGLNKQFEESFTEELTRIARSSGLFDNRAFQ